MNILNCYSFGKISGGPKKGQKRLRNHHGCQPETAMFQKMHLKLDVKLEMVHPCMS